MHHVDQQMYQYSKDGPTKVHWFMIRRYERGADPACVLNFLKDAAIAWNMARLIDMEPVGQGVAFTV